MIYTCIIPVYSNYDVVLTCFMDFLKHLVPENLKMLKCSYKVHHRDQGALRLVPQSCISYRYICKYIMVYVGNMHVYRSHNIVIYYYRLGSVKLIKIHHQRIKSIHAYINATYNCRFR